MLNFQTLKSKKHNWKSHFFLLKLIKLFKFSLDGLSGGRVILCLRLVIMISTRLARGIFASQPQSFLATLSSNTWAAQLQGHNQDFDSHYLLLPIAGFFLGKIAPGIGIFWDWGMLLLGVGWS
jgi:hypothetical protein